MIRVQWKFFSCAGRFLHWLWLMYSLSKLTLISLFYNDFADKYYIGDTCMEPMFWFVDHFTKVLGPICVVAVILLSLSLIVLAYAIGLPFYLKQNTFVLVLALFLGHWLLINVVFYYYMAYTTKPGYPPQGAMITEAVSICKKCIAPKPPRTHHCSVCNRCILKMDHHCPWLNNCVGHFNHRFFFMFCAYTWVGIVFVIIFGIPVFYSHFFSSSEKYSFSPVFISFLRSIGDIFRRKPVMLHKDSESMELDISSHFGNSTKIENAWVDTLYHSCIIYAALLCVAVICVLGGLLVWHARLISNGETSIEAHINKAERKRLLKNGVVYKNPYDFGTLNNWKIFLRVGYHRPWWHLLIPFGDPPVGNGIHWNVPNYPENKFWTKEAPNTCCVKVS